MPRASEAAPWVRLSLVEPLRPERAKAWILCFVLHTQCFYVLRFALSAILQNTHNKLFERALHADLFTLMAAKAINAHQCFARRVRSTLWNSH